ncbi:MAG TPA: Maf family protein [Thermodesulfobacteriota bacterium]|nr:Maf family protein [Thermodesulfobacteriota bacterium]
MKLPIVLASNSPRRRELLKQVGIPFEVIPSNVSEDFDPILPPHDVVQTLAGRKAESVAVLRTESLVIAADTIVVLDGEILGKPDSKDDAVRMLERLSGRTHLVITGVVLRCISQKVHEVLDVTTEVTFGDMSKQMVEKYVATGEPMDKAGAYGAQGMGAMFIKSIKGSYSNVVGLPLFEVVSMLRRYGNIG